MEEKKKRISEFDMLADDVQGKHSKRFNAMLVTMDDEDFAVNYFKILEYTAPKLQRREIVEEEKEFKLTLEHTYRAKEQADKEQAGDEI